MLAATRRSPPDGTTHWSWRRLAAHLGVSKNIVQRVWREAELRPHRLARYMASTDPDFETKAADIIELYLDPPRHAAGFCLDEKTAIQALDRRDRVLPLSPGRVEGHGFKYKRHGTLSLYAALNIQTGDVVGKTTARHTSQDFLGFLGEVVATCEPDQEIRVILDNLSAHKTKLVAAFLEAHPNVTLHFTPTYSPWLNQVELWFSKVQRDVLARGVFTSTADLARKLRRYIKAYAKHAEPFRWKYANPTRGIHHGKLTSQDSPLAAGTSPPPAPVIPVRPPLRQRVRQAEPLVSSDPVPLAPASQPEPSPASEIAVALCSRHALREQPCVVMPVQQESSEARQAVRVLLPVDISHRVEPIEIASAQQIAV